MFMTVLKLLLVLVASATAILLWNLIKFLHPLNSPLRNLRGPAGKSFFLGSLGDILNDDSNTLIEQWVQEYGGTLRFKGLFNKGHLITMDTRAMNHILTHSNDYQKSAGSRRGLAEIFGEGLLVVEGTQHRQQRRIMNPAFGPVQVRALTGTFLAKAAQLCDLWSDEIAKDPTAAIAGTRIDVVPWMSRVTLDIIGLAGFNYNFNALDSTGTPNELSVAFSTLFSSSQKITVFEVLRNLIPPLRLIPSSDSSKIQTARRTMTQIGKELLEQAKEAALSSATEKAEDALHGRDLLTLLVKANMATDTPESQRLSDKDVIAQVPTFFVAGHETTSSAITWALFALTQAPDVQTKLRDELFTVRTDTPSMDELVALPYLDAVVRETLRAYPPVPITSRVAMKDDMLPVDKPYTDVHGVVRNSIPVAKGDPIFIPILAMNRSKDLWGPDAQDFRPERWNNKPEAIMLIPGIWGHMLTFIGGPRACIGFRFSLVETKAILFCLIRAFEFELAVPASEIGSKTAIVQRPILRGDPTQPQLPLIVKPHQRS